MKKDRNMPASGRGTRDFAIEFYEDDQGRSPVLRWITEELRPDARRALTAALEAVLAKEGIAVCSTEFGRNVGEGIFEFRLRHDAAEILKRTGRSVTPALEASSIKILLRVFCHAYGDRRILVLGGYDKSANSHPRYQQEQLHIAKKRLLRWHASRRGGGGPDGRNGPCIMC